MQNILLGTQNRGKVVEIQHILEPFFIVVTPSEIGVKLTITEDGITYAQNAARKARAYAAASGLVALADDSGLEVDVLDGQPGLYSARYAPQPGATDQDRRRYLLQQLQGKPRPWTARFRCVVALTAPGEEVQYTEGICEGEIIPKERGSGGFGYDPIFYFPEKGCTMAELALEEKNTLSHRGRAVQAAIPILKALTKATGKAQTSNQ
jgi:XTP/dITP diphosphohydrolase